MRTRYIILVSVIGSLAVAAQADAQAATTASATPNRAGKASTVRFDIDGTAAPIDGRIPSALSLTTPPGFTFNRAAAPKQCSETSARLNECPAASQIGSGSLVINVNYVGHPPRNVTFKLKMYRQSSTKFLGVTFLAGTRVVPGFLSTSSGVGLRFDPLPTPPVFAQVSYALENITINLGVTRRVSKTVKHKHGKHVRITHKTVVTSLLRNPTTCTAGTWAASSMLAFPDGTSVSLPTPITCAR
jgi:hypothetical protein